MKLYFDSIENKGFGYFYFAVSDEGLRLVTFRRYLGLSIILEHACNNGFKAEENPLKTNLIKNQLNEFFIGKRRKFDFELDLNYLPLFAQKVLKKCYKIRYGKILTYGELAAQTGSAKAARAVGRIMATNPIPIVIPCHRVVGASGKLTGYGGGLDMKKNLLELEGVKIISEKAIIQKL